MSYPKRTKGTKACIAVTKDGVTVYGNRAAFRSLAKWMSWIAEADESEHYECHLTWHLQSNHSAGAKKNVWVLLDRRTSRLFKKTPRSSGFELTFMAVENADLKALERCQSSGLLPSKWEAQ